MAKPARKRQHPGEAMLATWARLGLDRLLLLCFAIFTVVAILGYGTFGLHPELLQDIPGALEFYASSYQLFSQGQVWFAFVLIVIYLSRSVGIKWLASFALVYGLSLSSELMGTNYGLPFGAYTYTELLGYKILGHVPVVIPLSWFYMALPSYFIARQTFKGEDSPGRTLKIIALGALLLTIWDLALDPAMSYLTPFWVWSDTGPYYNMPWLNLAGWYVTGLALMGAFTALKTSNWVDSLDRRWVLPYYGLNVILPIGMCAVAGSWLAVIVTTLAVAGVFTFIYWVKRPTL